VTNTTNEDQETVVDETTEPAAETEEVDTTVEEDALAGKSSTTRRSPYLHVK
jgi:hypothetical protein